MLMIVPLRPIRHGHLLWSLVTQPKQIVKCGVSLDDDLSPIANLVIVRWSVMLHTLSITSIVSRSSCHVKTEQSVTSASQICFCLCVMRGLGYRLAWYQFIVQLQAHHTSIDAGEASVMICWATRWTFEVREILVVLYVQIGINSR